MHPCLIEFACRLVEPHNKLDFPAALVSLVYNFWRHIQIWFQHNDTKSCLFLAELIDAVRTVFLCSWEPVLLFFGRLPCITEGIQPFVLVPTFFLAICDAIVPRKNPRVFQQVMRFDEPRISFDGIEVMEAGMRFHIRLYCGRWKPLIPDNQPFCDTILREKSLIGCKIKHISGKAFGADWLHGFQIESE